MLLRMLGLLALLTLVVGESGEPSIGGYGAPSLDDAAEGLGEAKEGTDFPTKKEPVDKEGQEPGDGSDPEKGGSEDEKTGDDGDDAVAPPLPEPLSMQDLLDEIATKEPPGPLVPTAAGGTRFDSSLMNSVIHPCLQST